MPPIPRRRKQPWLRWFRALLLVMGFASLGYAGYSLLDAQLYQSYENWRFDREVTNSRPSAAAFDPKFVIASSRTHDDVPPPPVVVPGAVLGRLEIARLDVSVIIAEGTDGKILRRAAGHIPGTSLPGEAGNVAISGHRDTFFRPLKDIREGDVVTLTTLNGSYRYRVDSTAVVEPDDVAVLKDSAAPTLTLVTCYPFYFVGPAPKRFIVRAHRM
jgi:sortase A